MQKSKPRPRADTTRPLILDGAARSIVDSSLTYAGQEEGHPELRLEILVDEHSGGDGRPAPHFHFEPSPSFHLPDMKSLGGTVITESDGAIEAFYVDPEDEAQVTPATIDSLDPSQVGTPLKAWPYDENGNFTGNKLEGDA